MFNYSALYKIIVFVKVTTIIAAVAVFSAGMAYTLFGSVYSEQEFTASLSGDHEVPPNNSTGKGFASLKPMGDEISYKVNSSGLNNVTTIHIHGGKSADYGREVIATLQAEKKPINGVVGHGNITTYDLMGNLSGASTSDLVKEVQRGKVYINIHTDSFPNGEIRGLVSNRTVH